MNANAADARQSARPPFSERTGWPFGLRGGSSEPNYIGGKPDERIKSWFYEIAAQRNLKIICSVFDVGVHISMT